MILDAAGAHKITRSYDQQRYYAERARQIKLPKTVQIGVEDRVSISPAASAQLARAEPPPPRALTYDDPRRESHRRQPEKVDRERDAANTPAADITGVMQSGGRRVSNRPAMPAR